VDEVEEPAAAVEQEPGKFVPPLVQTHVKAAGIEQEPGEIHLSVGAYLKGLCPFCIEPSQGNYTTNHQK
jgi:hypothetical protein